MSYDAHHVLKKMKKDPITWIHAFVPPFGMESVSLTGDSTVSCVPSSESSCPTVLGLHVLISSFSFE